MNEFDPDGDFDVLVPDMNEQLGEGTSGWAVDEADTTWGTGGTDKPDDKPDDPPKDQPDEPEDVMYNFPDLGGQFDDGGTVDGGFFGGHWNDGGNTDGNWGWGKTCPHLAARSCLARAHQSPRRGRTRSPSRRCRR